MSKTEKTRVIGSWSGTFEIQIRPVLTEEEYLKTQIPTERGSYQNYLEYAKIVNDIEDSKTQDQKWGLDKPLTNNINPLEFLKYREKNKNRMEEQR